MTQPVHPIYFIVGTHRTSGDAIVIHATRDFDAAERFAKSANRDFQEGLTAYSHAVAMGASPEFFGALDEAIR